MYNRFSAYGNVATGTSLTLIGLKGAATCRPCVIEFGLSSNATPADVATQFQWLRFTAAGTAGSTFTAIPLDPGDRAAIAVVGVGTYSVEPTYTASSQLWGQTINQRATYRWVAAPYCEIIGPATTNNGLGLRSIASGGTPVFDAQVYFLE